MMEKDFNDLGKWLPPRMEKRGLTAEKLSQMTGVSRSSIYNYLIDACRPSTQTMAKICRVLGEPLEAGLRQYTPRKVGNPYFGPNNPWTTGLRRRK